MKPIVLSGTIINKIIKCTIKADFIFIFAIQNITKVSFAINSAKVSFEFEKKNFNTMDLFLIDVRKI